MSFDKSLEKCFSDFSTHTEILLQWGSEMFTKFKASPTGNYRNLKNQSHSIDGERMYSWLYAICMNVLPFGYE